MKPILSDPNQKSLAEREAAARLAIYRKLNECFCLLAVLGDYEKAARLDDLISAWHPDPTKSPTNPQPPARPA